jgi:glutamate racemase
VQFVARETRGRGRTEVAVAWVKRMVEAIRSRDQRHLITVGLVDWSLDGPGLTSGFVPASIGPLVDFLCVHIYPEAKRLERVGEILQGFQTGRPLVVEETFALKCSGEELERVIRGARNVAGWISFYWGVRPEEYQTEKSIGEALTADWLKRFSGLLREGAVVRSMSEHCAMHGDGRAAYTVDLSAWGAGSAGENVAANISQLPIGVFDSGIGGLTVLEALFKADYFHNETFAPGADGRPDFVNERFIYFGDQANMPYGNYPSAGKADFLKELILKDATFLLGRRYWNGPEAHEPSYDKPPVKAIVIACNTATAWGLQEIRQLTASLGVPVFVLGVVDSGAAALAERTGKDQQRTVAVLATVGTCSSGAWPRALERTLGQAGRRQPLVLQQGSRGMAGAIEGDPAFVSAKDGSAAAYAGPAVGRADALLESELLSVYGFDPAGLLGRADEPATLRLNSVTNYIRYDVVTLLENYRRTGGRTPIDTLVLGCTHFPLVQSEILAEFERLRTLERDGHRPWSGLVAEQLEVIDPATVVARDLFRRLAEQRAFAQTPQTSSSGMAGDQFFMSVPNPRYEQAQLTPAGGLETNYKYGRIAGRLTIEDTLAVPLRWELLPASGAELVRRHLPEVAKRLGQ